MSFNAGPVALRTYAREFGDVERVADDASRCRSFKGPPAKVSGSEVKRPWPGAMTATPCDER